MAKLIMFFTFAFVGASILSGIMMGGGGLAVTQLDGGITEADVTITVDSTDGYLTADVITIEDEEIAYTGTTATEFTGCTRGYNGTTASAHSSGLNAYTTGTSVINSALGFNVASTAATFGALAVVTIPFKFFTTTLPRLIAWNFAFLQGDLAWVAFFFFAVSIGLVVVLALQMISVAQGIVRR